MRVEEHRVIRDEAKMQVKHKEHAARNDLRHADIDCTDDDELT